MTLAPRRRRTRLALPVLAMVVVLAGGGLGGRPAVADEGDRVSGDRVSGPPSPARPGDERPNIVVILTDDMRADDLRYLPQTRRLLAGARFSHAISSHPLCCPARAMLHTGEYAQNNGVRANAGVRGGFDGLYHPDATIARSLHDSGYLTALHGKYLNGYERSDGLQAGWDVWDPLVDGIYAYDDFEFFGGDRYEQDYVTHRLSERSNATVTAWAGPGAPFYLYVNHTAPHETVVRDGQGFRQVEPLPEPRYADVLDQQRSPSFGAPSYGRRGGWPRDLGRRDADPERVQRLFLARIRTLRSVDDAVGSLVATLRDTGELDHTYLVFTSDNGFQLGEHTYLTKNLLARESLSVPLLVAGPKVVRRTVSAPVSLLDLPATFLELADVRPERPVDGASLLPFLRGRDAAPWRDTTLVQTGSNGSRGRVAGWRMRGVVTGRYLFGVDVTEPRHVLLFDHRRDPYEIRNLARSPRYHPVRVALAQRYRELADCAGVASCNRDFRSLPAPSGGDSDGIRRP